MNEVLDAQNEIVEEFRFFDSWMDRYQYLIDLGRKLPPLEAQELEDENLLEGCQSRVWLLIDGDAGQVRIRANSDAAIVSGLIALLIRVYSGASARAIVDTEPFFINELGLTEHLVEQLADLVAHPLDGAKGLLEDVAHQVRDRHAQLVGYLANVLSQSVGDTRVQDPLLPAPALLPGPAALADHGRFSSKSSPVCASVDTSWSLR